MTRRRTKAAIAKSQVEGENVETENNEKWLKKIVSPKALKDIKLTDKQNQLIEVIDKNNIIFIVGPAGTSKTFASCYYAINCLKTHKYEKIILTKPVQEAGENLGFLPGSIDEKIAPHYESFVTNILKFIDKKTLERNYKDGVIENKPLAYMRGANFDDCLIIGDEFQNADIRALIMFITRMGKNSKVIICGDVSQHDIGKDFVALEYLIKLIGDVQGVGVFRFSEEDIMRHPILIEITKRYEKAKREDNKLPKVKKS